jgi:hypothetical protein
MQQQQYEYIFKKIYYHKNNPSFTHITSQSHTIYQYILIFFFFFYSIGYITWVFHLIFVVCISSTDRSRDFSKGGGGGARGVHCYFLFSMGEKCVNFTLFWHFPTKKGKF